MDWKPIETAPKDGTHVLLFGPRIDLERFADSGSDCVVGWWHERAGFRGEGWYSDIYEMDGCGCDSYMSPVQLQPTHWAPLPEPPHD